MIEPAAPSTGLDARWRFQASLNAALATYLHGADLTRAGRLLFPLVDAARPSLEEVRRTARSLGIRLLGTTPQVLAAGFAALDDLPAPPGAVREFALPAWDERRHGRIGSLREARRDLLEVSRRNGVEFFLHGSFASLDFTGYSDLDTFVLVPRTCAVDPAGLQECRRGLVRTMRALKEFDPLQHHGHFVLTEIDLRGYPDPLFPDVILERTIALAPRTRYLRARSLPAPALAAARFGRLAEGYLANDLGRGLGNAYRLKSALSVFMLLPALWWQARGRPIDKREALEEVYRMLSPPAVGAFRRAAEIRAVWRYREPTWNRWVRRLWFNPLLPAALDAAGARPPAPTVRRLVDARFLADTKAAVRELIGLAANRSAGRGARPEGGRAGR
ncbi:MAG: nucleotidyltransferase family protein [Planctomycetota bacterium]|jgi:predicted nucleotidyltransferase